MSWRFLGPGAALVAYGWVFRHDLGWPSYVLISIGLAVAAAGEDIQRRLLLLRDRTRGNSPSRTPAEALQLCRRRFGLAIVATCALGAFSLWRAQMTVWRPVAERFYLLAPDTWLGRIERCWFNDALYALGMAGILYALYNCKEFLADRPYCALLPGEDQWDEHQERSGLIVGTGVGLILVWAWLEEIADLVPGYVFDKWDLIAIYLGFLVGYSMIRRLPYPLWGARPAFHVGRQRTGWLAEGLRLPHFAYVWIYTSLADPESGGERWLHMSELLLIIAASTWVLRRSRQPHQAHLSLRV